MVPTRLILNVLRTTARPRWMTSSRGLSLPSRAAADVVGQLVDDVVLADLDAALFGELQGRVVGHDVEADDHRVLRRRQGQLHVAFGDAADGRVQNADAHFVVDELFQFLADGLDGAAGSALRMTFSSAILVLAVPSLSRVTGLKRMQGRLLHSLLAFLGDLAGLGQFGDDEERVVGVGHFVQAGDADRHARPRLLDRPAQVVVHGANAAESRPADDDVASVQRAVAGPAAWPARLRRSVRFASRQVPGRLVRVGLQFLQLGDQRDRVQQLVDALALGGAGATNGTSPPMLSGSRSRP